MRLSDLWQGRGFVVGWLREFVAVACKEVNGIDDLLAACLKETPLFFYLLVLRKESAPFPCH